MLTVKRRLCLDPQVEGFAAGRGREPPALRDAMLGNVQVRLYLDDVDESYVLVRSQVEPWRFKKIAVYPYSYSTTVTVPLDVNVARAFGDRFEQQGVEHRCVLGFHESRRREQVRNVIGTLRCRSREAGKAEVDGHQQAAIVRRRDEVVLHVIRVERLRELGHVDFRIACGNDEGARALRDRKDEVMLEELARDGSSQRGIGDGSKSLLVRELHSALSGKLAKDVPLGQAVAIDQDFAQPSMCRCCHGRGALDVLS